MSRMKPHSHERRAANSRNTGSSAVNAVSRLHGHVSRRLFQPLFPSWPEREVPVGHVTNGVHLPSWMARRIEVLLDEVRGPEWEERIDDAVATERCARRGGVVVGRVHDENTALMGGVSGHAGAFCDAPDLLRFGVHMLGIDQGQGPGIVSREILRWCWSEAARGAAGHHLGGWDTPSGARSSAGRHMTPDATVGHLGFTGTSLWIDRAQQRVAVLLTNRVHPTRDNPHILAMRIAFHEAVAPALSRA